jgi:hypothetical protein
MKRRRVAYVERMTAAAVCGLIAIGCAAVAVSAFSAYPVGALEEAQRQAWDAVLAVPFLGSVLFVTLAAVLLEGRR